MYLRMKRYSSIPRRLVINISASVCNTVLCRFRSFRHFSYCV